MGCYYVEEVIDQINEEIALYEQRVKEYGQDGDVDYALQVLKRLKNKIEELEIKEFNYGE